MSATTKITLRLPDELAQQVAERVKVTGVSQNDWLVRAVKLALAAMAEGRSFELSETTTVKLEV